MRIVKPFIFLVASVTVITLSCNTDQRDSVGFIDYKKAITVDSFRPCDDYIYQYYNSAPAAGYKYGKNALRHFVMTHYTKKYTESGYLTFRFIINCEGRAGAYEIVENDLDFNPKVFSDSIKSDLFELVGQLTEWTPGLIDSVASDSFMYISFRLEDGKIAEILP